ncbi:RNA 2',3'-cyclic phosphodiesterase [Allosphingosinicella sp.]|jgi:2'-5' RNA ligase|uniref:RNA 2',3'-cyclic phosphodiesterase n=1 Tax=Allosphingosinicella sp. TaxID=2823234 RepID=UPI002F0AF4F2
MHRLFAAIRPSAAIRARLLAAMGGISGARWQTDDQLHLTLRFIGEVGPHLADDVHAALGSVHHPAFELAIAGLGAFERRGQPETIWAGVAPQEPLRSLHKKIDQALARIGVEREGRAYLPHITLARLKPSAGPPAHLIEQAGGLSSEPFAVDSFILYQSDLAPDGAVYSVVERYPLG